MWGVEMWRLPSGEGAVELYGPPQARFYLNSDVI